MTRKSRAQRIQAQLEEFFPTVEPALGQLGQHTRFLPEDQRQPALAAEAKQRFSEAAAYLERSLAGKSYLLGDHFSAADVVLGTLLNWSRQLGALRRPSGEPGISTASSRTRMSTALLM